MKRTIATALVAFTALTGAASAMTVSAGQLSLIGNYAPQADLSALTAAEVETAVSIIHSGDSEGEKRNQIRALVQ